MAPKNKPNAYSTFMLEYINQQRKQGNTVSMHQAQSICSPMWNKLTPEEKNEYKVRAKSSTYEVEKKSCDAINLNALHRQERMAEEGKKNVTKEITQIINNLERTVDLEERGFAIIHCHMACKTIADEFYPAEIAIVYFNLYDGGKCELHAIVDAGDLPQGYQWEAGRYAESTHKLPYKAHGVWSDDRVVERVGVHDVHDMLKEFLRRRFHNVQAPILFALPENEDCVRGCIDTINNRVAEDAVNVRIAPLDLLFWKFKNRCAQVSGQIDLGFRFQSSALEELNRDVSAYQTGISCQFHTEDAIGSEKFQMCSMSIALRHMYYICDHCCTLLNLPLTPGNHCPPGVVVPPCPSAEYSYNQYDSSQYDYHSYQDAASQGSHRNRDYPGSEDYSQDESFGPDEDTGASWRTVPTPRGRGRGRRN